MKFLLHPAVLLALVLGACSGSSTSSSGMTPCKRTLAQACATQLEPGVPCKDTWTQALAEPLCGVSEQQADCGAYQSLTFTNVDFAYTYYYDKSTGALVSVVASGASKGAQCTGGPTSFTQPSCGPSHAVDSCPKDAGSG